MLIMIFFYARSKRLAQNQSIDGVDKGTSRLVLVTGGRVFLASQLHQLHQLL
jgi:hypothetical protein